jgi:hypothetical protein
MRYLQKNLQDPAKAHDWVIDDFKPSPTDTDNGYRYLSKGTLKTDRKKVDMTRKGKQDHYGKRVLTHAINCEHVKNNS